MRSVRNAIVVGFAVILGLGQARAGEFDSILRWRNIGPYRGGRTRAVSGVPSQPNVFYMAQVNGGVFKTTDYGRTWQPIFDDQPTAFDRRRCGLDFGSERHLRRQRRRTASARILSVGDGIYKSTDAGKTWTHLGLRRRPADRADRGRSAESGPHLCRRRRSSVRAERRARHLSFGRRRQEHSRKCLYRDENIGGERCADRPEQPGRSFTLRCGKRAKARGKTARCNGDNGGIFKSVDGGKTWRQLTQRSAGHDRAGEHRDRAERAENSLRRSRGRKTIAKLYRSDDGGERWSGTTDDPRPGFGIGGGDLPVVRFDPKNPQIVYSAQRGLLEIDGRRQDVGRLARCARRRRLSERLDQSEQPGNYSARERSGRDHHGERRRDLEFVV